MIEDDFEQAALLGKVSIRLTEDDLKRFVLLDSPVGVAFQAADTASLLAVRVQDAFLISRPSAVPSSLSDAAHWRLKSASASMANHLRR